MSKESFPSVAVFASGEGTLFQSIADPMICSKHGYSVHSLVTNKADCGAAQKARALGVEVLEFPRDCSHSSFCPNLIVLAGFLKKIPVEFLASFPNEFINSHPSLLPKFGGKGMYGTHVHKAVLDGKESVSGFTVHYVTKNYDEGQVLYQEEVPITAGETVDSLATKIKQREQAKLPELIGKLLKRQGQNGR